MFQLRDMLHHMDCYKDFDEAKDTQLASDPPEMEPVSYDQIMQSKIFQFIVGHNKKVFNVHEAAISGLSKPLGVLLEGPFKEARELRVDWPEVDESTFVRFTEWAYTRNYGVATPKTVLDPAGETESTANAPKSERALYSLSSLSSPSSFNPFAPLASQAPIRDCCRNPKCIHYQKNEHYRLEMVPCVRCRKKYACQVCTGSIHYHQINDCHSAFNDCSRPSCAGNRKVSPGVCCNQACDRYRARQLKTNMTTVCCPFCRNNFTSLQCHGCSSVLSECPRCPFEASNDKRSALIITFMTEAGTIYPPLAQPYLPQARNRPSEDYTDVFLCHAKLYVLGDLYDIPALRQLSFHRLYATLKHFQLYPSRMGDIATLARYLFENTRPADKIRDMITLYYACIIEDASKHDGVKSLIDDLPDFAHSLIVKMSDRLS